MPLVDEFGRAIPAGGGGGGGQAAENDHHHENNNNDDYGHHHPHSHHNNNSSSHHAPPAPPPYRERSDHHGSSSRDNRDRRPHRYNNNNNSEVVDRDQYLQSYGPSSSSLHHSRESYDRDRDHDRSNWRQPPHRGGGGGGEYNSNRDRERYRIDRDNNSRGPPPRRNSSSSVNKGEREPRGSERDSDHHSQQQQPPHPSLRYVQDPMLCQFLWKEQNETGGAAAAGADSSAKPQQDNGDERGEGEESSEQPSNNATSEAKEDDSNNNNDDTNAKTYEDYRLEYAWNVLKHFFNQHLDDSWFRQQFSPALMVEAAQLERKRCHAEAKALKREFTSNNNNNNKKRGFSKEELALEVSPSALESNAPLPVPTPHLFSTLHRTLHVRMVPPHVTDEHVKQALLPYLTEHVVQQQIQQKQQGKTTVARPDKKNTPSSAEVLDTTVFGLFSSTPYNTHQPPLQQQQQQPQGANSRSASSGSGRSVFLHRSVFCVCTSKEVLDGVLHWMQHRDKEESASSSQDDAAAKNLDTQHIPRKQDDKQHTSHSSSSGNDSLDLEIDCTDPYGRTEYDANGRGGPPPDGLPVPPRKAVVSVSRCGLGGGGGGVVKLSAALSSPSRFVGDQEAATTLARALDVRQHVPVEDRLDSLLEQVQSQINNSNKEEEDEDKEETTSRSSNIDSTSLDISLAYLRRVHLYSFYKAAKADSFGDVLAGKSAAAQIQLREAGVGMPENEDAAALLKEDLLGQRLDDSIRQALEVDCHSWIAAADWLVNETIDTCAQEIREAEERATDEWIKNHFMDDDGRARCSFHFCHKLFKDESFLSKHLLKKHHAYNQCERAKCHDQYMMSTWERAALRPSVPAILVDCGKQFGSHESHLSGGPEPRATDPEPALWERKQYQEKLLLERQELRSKRPEHALGGGGGGGDDHHHRGGRPEGRTPRNFVDVDDMKEETVEVSFDQVQLPPPVAAGGKKKKKKRKLL